MAIGRRAAVVALLVPLAGSRAPLAGGSPATSRDPMPMRYYVASTGSDQNPGTASAPFETIQKATEVVSPGDVVIVRVGVYGGGSRVVEMQRGGAPGAWVTFRSETPGAAILDGRKGTSAEAWYFGRRVGYVRVEGFEVRGFREHAFDFYGGGVHDIRIVRNHIHHIGRNCTGTSNGRTGASLGEGAHRITFDGNIWHDIGRLGPGEDGCSPPNANYQNHDHGIYVADAHEITIKNNVFHAFERGWAIHRYSSRGFESRSLLILNNTFVGSNPYRPGQIILATPTAGLRVVNNIFSRPGQAAIYFENVRFSGAEVRYNMIHKGVTKVGRPGGVTFSRNWEYTDPRLTDGIEPRPASGSPALDVGVPLVDVTHDAEGKARPQGAGYDLGAYER